MLVNGGISDYFSMPIRTTGDISEATFAVVILSKDGILNYIAFGPIEDYQINIKEFMP
ncbi:MAG: hypothetical protein IIX60_01905 [Clostridia bacterium]|nr:hypothetical protein [Clostridia bacterium]